MFASSSSAKDLICLVLLNDLKQQKKPIARTDNVETNADSIRKDNQNNVSSNSPVKGKRNLVINYQNNL